MYFWIFYHLVSLFLCPPLLVTQWVRWPRPLWSLVLTNSGMRFTWVRCFGPYFSSYLHYKPARVVPISSSLYKICLDSNSLWWEQNHWMKDCAHFSYICYLSKDWGFLLLLTGLFLNYCAPNSSKNWAGLSFYNNIISFFIIINGRSNMYITTYFNSGCAFNQRRLPPRPLWFTMCPKGGALSGVSQYTDLPLTKFAKFPTESDRIF